MCGNPFTYLAPHFLTFRQWQMSPSLLKLMKLIKSNELDKLETQEHRNKASTEVLTIIYQMKKTTEFALKQKVKGAVIAVPSYFDDGQRKFIEDVGEIAGLKVTLIDEPKASGLYVYTLTYSGVHIRITKAPFMI